MSPKTIPSADRPIVARLERPMEGVASGCGGLDTTCCIWPNPAILEMRFMSLLSYPPCWSCAPLARDSPKSARVASAMQEAPRSAPRRIRCARLIPKLLTISACPFQPGRRAHPRAPFRPDAGIRKQPSRHCLTSIGQSSLAGAAPASHETRMIPPQRFTAWSEARTPKCRSGPAVLLQM